MSKRSTWSPARRRKERDKENARRAARAREANPALPPYAPRQIQGATTIGHTPNIPEGQELAGLSTRTDDGWVKTRAAGNPNPELPPPDFALSGLSTMSRADGSEVIRWRSYDPVKVAHYQATLDAWSRHAALYAGLAGTSVAPDKALQNPDLLNIIPIGDPHIGMLAWKPETGDHFDTAIAVRELRACVRELIADLPACPRVIIGNLGDALHAQDDSARTPGHGNQLDVDGRYPKILDALHVLFRGMIDDALAKHEHVTFRNLPGNHDPRVAAEIMLWLRAVYEREPRVTIADAYAAHQYDHFGKNLIGWHHGDRTRKAELPAIMASDHDGAGTGLWGQTTEHNWFVGHEHHTTVLETPSCFVRVMNTLAGRDAYHAGRYRAKQMLQAFTYHREFGVHRQYTVSLARVRAALSREVAA